MMAYYLGLLLISAGTLLLEIALLRLFAVQQFYHFAFMAISLALLGAGASGTWLSLRGRRFDPGWLCLAFSLAVVAAYLTINNLPFDSFTIAWDRRQAGFLALYFLAAAVPFLFAGLLVGGELMAAGAAGRPGRGSHQVYGANLLGSAAGALASLPLLAAGGGEGAVVVVALLGAVAGLLLGSAASAVRRGPVRLGQRLALLLLIALSLTTLWRPPAWLAPRLSPYKALPVLQQALDARHVLTRQNATARLDVIESSTIHLMPGLSLGSPVDVPPQAGVTLDGDNLMPVTLLAPETPVAAALADYLPGGLAHRLRPRARTLVLEAGTGMDVLLALAAGAAEVTAVVENRLLIETVRRLYGPETGELFDHPRVTLVNSAGRVFARQPGAGPFDIVDVALTDPHRPVTSGAYSLTENYLYTIEGFTDYLRLLDDNGLLVASRWLQTPPSESGRLFATMAAALAAEGLDPARHLVALRTLRTMTVLAARQPFTPAEIDAVRAFLEERGFDAVYYPGLQAAELNRHQVLPEPTYHNLFTAILSDPAAAYRDYRFRIDPPRDNQPFFFHFFKWRQTPEILATLGVAWQPFGGSGFFVLLALLLLVALAAAFFIVGPLLLRPRGRRRPAGPPVPLWRWRVLAYFACLGLAFLFVEVPLAQRFILVLDQPVTALAIVLFTLLLFSGLGSLTVRRWRLTRALALLVLLIALYPLLLAPLSAAALRWPELARAFLTLLALAPLGYLMGLPFAGGLRLVERYEPGLVPWAWAINGSFSVISSVLAVLLALTWGFALVLWLGAAAYAGAGMAFYRIEHHAQSVTRNA